MLIYILGVKYHVNSLIFHKTLEKKLGDFEGNFVKKVSSFMRKEILANTGTN